MADRGALALLNADALEPYDRADGRWRPAVLAEAVIRAALCRPRQETEPFAGLGDAELYALWRRVWGQDVVDAAALRSAAEKLGVERWRRGV